jgi:hypothetical protein
MIRCASCQKKYRLIYQKRYYLLNREKINKYQREFYQKYIKHNKKKIKLKNKKDKLRKQKFKEFLLTASYEELKFFLNPSSLPQSFYEKRYERSKHLLRMIEKTNKRKEGTAL